MKTAKKILIVEDEPALQDAFKLILELGGHTIYTAKNGLIGLEHVRSYRPDIVLLDIFMPVMDGKEFLRNLDLEAYPSMKIIVYSNLSDQRTEAEAYELGAHDFVLKSSMTPRDLLGLVAKHLK